MCMVVHCFMFPFSHMILPNISVDIAVTGKVVLPNSHSAAGIVNAWSAVYMSPSVVTNLVHSMIEYSLFVSFVIVIVHLAGVCSLRLFAILIDNVCSYSNDQE